VDKTEEARDNHRRRTRAYDVLQSHIHDRRGNRRFDEELEPRASGARLKTEPINVKKCATVKVVTIASICRQPRRNDQA
jgi:hypothetical protein